MPDLAFKPVEHDHRTFIARARARNGFDEAHRSLLLGYQLVHQLLEARARAGLTQDAVAERMGANLSAVARLESATKYAPSLASLQRYAQAVGCELQVTLVPAK